jgi:hypothetical protein
MRYLILFTGLIFAISAMGCLAPPTSPPVTPSPQAVTVTATVTVPVPVSTLRTPLPPSPAITEFSGSGNGIRTLTTTDYEMWVFSMNNAGNSNFVVRLKDNNGDLIYLLADEIGPWGGSISKSLDPGTYTIDVKATGAWAIEIQPQP